MEHITNAKFRRQHGLRLVQMRIEHVQCSIVRQRAIDPHSRMRHGYLPLSEFAAIVQPIIETCDLDAICENPPAYVY
jgi:hypothetical protein